MVVRYGKLTRSVTKILGSVFNLPGRHHGLEEHKDNRERLAPSDDYLFGGRLAEVSKNLKDSAQVSNFGFSLINCVTLN